MGVPLAHVDRVTVGRGTRDAADAEHAGRPADVFNNDALTERHLHAFRQDAAEYVGRSAGRERHHHGDRTRRIDLRGRGAGTQCSGGERSDEGERHAHVGPRRYFISGYFICAYSIAIFAPVGNHPGYLEPQPLETILPAMSGKRAFLELLKQEGVEVVFGTPRTPELPLMDAFAVENEIRYVLGLQEAALMAMADGYAQASGKLAVLNLHVAPGLGNAMGMLYDAQKASSPVLVTAGQQDTEYLVTEPVLSGDLATLARPFVKWAAEVARLADLPRLVHRAAKTALAPPTGPVFLALPGDILKAEADLDLMTPTRVAPRLRGDADAVATAAALLAEAKRPVIMAGGGGGRA